MLTIEEPNEVPAFKHLSGLWWETPATLRVGMTQVIGPEKGFCVADFKAHICQGTPSKN